MEETKLYNLFLFPELCSICQELYRPAIQMEVIPMDGGFIEYYYLYADIKTTVLQREYLTKYYHLLYQNEQIYKGNIIIMLDLRNMKELKNEIKFLKPFQKIIILSLIRINLDVFMSFL